MGETVYKFKHGNIVLFYNKLAFLFIRVYQQYKVVLYKKVMVTGSVLLRMSNTELCNI